MRLAVLFLLLMVAPAAAQMNHDGHDDRFPVPPPSGGFTHVPEGMVDPYPTYCCHGRDCSPWAAEDVVPLGNGGYRILSLNAVVPRAKVKPVTREMSQLAIALNGEATPYHLCIRRDPFSGEPVYSMDGSVTVHCFFVGEGM